MVRDAVWALRNAAAPAAMGRRGRSGATTAGYSRPGEAGPDGIRSGRKPSTASAKTLT